jgi:hypothetical protein
VIKEMGVQTSEPMFPVLNRPKYLESEITDVRSHIPSRIDDTANSNWNKRNPLGFSNEMETRRLQPTPKSNYIREEVGFTPKNYIPVNPTFF